MNVPRPLLFLGLVVLLNTPLQTSAGELFCSFATLETDVPASAGAPPTWSDERYKTVSGRKEIISEASILVMKKMQRCNDTGAETPLTAEMPICSSYSGECDYDLTGNVEWRDVFFVLSVATSYVPVQKKADKGARIEVTFTDVDQGWWATPSGTYAADPKEISPSEVQQYEDADWDVEHRVKHHCRAEIEVFPSVFERRQLFIKSEHRWARTPVEAMAYVLLHELGHLESQMAAQASDTFKAMDSSEDGVWQYAQSVMRCSRE